MADLDTPQVKQAEDWYASRPDYMARLIDRMQRYLYYIVIEVEKRGMLDAAVADDRERVQPDGVFDQPRVRSQFIPRLGSHGMKQTVDGRAATSVFTGGALDDLQSSMPNSAIGTWPRRV